MAKTSGGVRQYIYSSSQTPNVENKVSFDTIQDFADKVLSDGFSRGRELRIGTLNEAVQREMQNMKADIDNTDVVITDDVIIKYVNHPKNAKNETLPENQYNKLKNIVNNPKHIYIDTKQNNLVFVFTSKENKGKIIKAIIQPNFKKGSRVYNKVKSIGVVDANQISKQRQYKKIK